MAKTYTPLREFKSSSSNATYVVSQDENGDLSCTCLGWRFHSERHCKHTDEVRRVSNGGLPQALSFPAKPKVENFGKGDRVKLISNAFGVQENNPVWGSSYGKIGGTIISVSGASLPIHVDWDNGKGNDYTAKQLSYLTKAEDPKSGKFYNLKRIKRIREILGKESTLKEIKEYMEILERRTGR